MNIEQNIVRYAKLNADEVIQNLIEQANSRYILFTTNEQKLNFPRYTIDDNKLNILSFYYLDIACSFAENGHINDSISPMEKGASILEYVHGSEANRSEESNYYCLISSLAYYASFQYSKSFILNRKTIPNLLIAEIISLFLKRDLSSLIIKISEMAVDIKYSDDFISENNKDNEDDARQGIYEISIAKSINDYVQFFFTGDDNYLRSAKDRLISLKVIAEINKEPTIWWVIRLLIIISDGLTESSLWKSLGKYFDTNNLLVEKYINSLTFQKPRGIYELFIPQRYSLEKVIDPSSDGCIVTIPTSSGKTRIAEIAILNSFAHSPEKKILYIAPFRSLAFEIEVNLGKVFGNTEIAITHLYGGNIFSRLDEQIIQESNVIIATPEKAKSIIRGNRHIANQFSLLIIDEGHLLGPDKRLISNEIFLEELRYFAILNKSRFLVLSAVLPNADDIALWLTNSNDTVYKDIWRPSDERIGTLNWNGSTVNLNWINNDIDRPTFNNSFIVKEQLPLVPPQRKHRYFPSNKNEAVASTAYKFRNNGVCLIFVGLKRSVFVMADAYLKCLGNNPEDYIWSNLADWKSFELSSIEHYGDNNNWLIYAKKGILCHHGGLHSDVRIPLERLMRYDKPKVIIATSTLGQGVNIGVSTVIFSTIYQADDLVSTRDFWNIAGRAGRAFVDTEGKILVALDSSNLNSERDRQKHRYTLKTIEGLFNKSRIDNALSGVLYLVSEIKRLASSEQIDFEFLIELITNNNITSLGEIAKDIESRLDIVDDTLLALMDLNNTSDDSLSFEWIDVFFRKSLAFIQLKHQTNLTEDNLISFLNARVKGIVNEVGTNKLRWKSIINSGLPLKSDLYIEDKLGEIILLIKEYQQSSREIDGKIKLLALLTKIVIETPILAEDGYNYDNTRIEEILKHWLKGLSLIEILKLDNAEEFINGILTFKMPWILNGISKKLIINAEEELASIVEELSMLVEIGVPNIKALKIYNAGIRSRLAATEIAQYFGDESESNNYRKFLNAMITYKDSLLQHVSDKTAQWIELVVNRNSSNKTTIDTIPSFKLRENPKNCMTLVPREIKGKQYLMSPNLSSHIEIGKSSIDFSFLSKFDGIYFKYDDSQDVWNPIINNPYIQIGATS